MFERRKERKTWNKVKERLIQPGMGLTKLRHFLKKEPFEKHEGK
jgi:hypothetical protein